MPSWEGEEMILDGIGHQNMGLPDEDAMGDMSRDVLIDANVAFDLPMEPACPSP